MRSNISQIVRYETYQSNPRTVTSAVDCATEQPTGAATAEPSLPPATVVSMYHGTHRRRRPRRHLAWPPPSFPTKPSVHVRRTDIMRICTAHAPLYGDEEAAGRSGVEGALVGSINFVITPEQGKPIGKNESTRCSHWRSA